MAEEFSAKSQSCVVDVEVASITVIIIIVVGYLQLAFQH